MACDGAAGGFYRPRKPKESPFYRLVERFYPEFEQVYEQRYQKRYGFWRPAVASAVEKFLECGDARHGFARVRCPECGGEMKIISFIERHQSEVIEKILKHCGMWQDESARAPPEEAMTG
jgi:hypothetical protein